MNKTLTVALAQLDLVVGDVSGNSDKIIEYAERARVELRADLVIFPELSICGYPPEDLLFHSGLRRRVVEAVERVRDSVRGIAVLIGFPEYDGNDIFNSCAVFNDGLLLAAYRKQVLPNYRVFDEVRYFTPGKDATVFSLSGIRVGLSICEDAWQAGPTQAARAAGAEVILVINGSPYEIDIQQKREEAVRQRVRASNMQIGRAHV
jgi:NAD+ synthase (glutamine-hydrolysing)